MCAKRKKIEITSEDEELSAQVGRASELRDADFSQLEDQELHPESASLDRSAPAAGASDGKVAELEALLAESQDKYLRALAEFENFKKRTIKERSDLLKYQGERIFVDIIGIVDTLELALENADADPEKLKEGIKLIHKMFVDVLSKWEVRPESGVGKPFDPTRHSALSRVPADDATPGTIINEFRKAYLYKDRLLRPAEVVVAAEASPAERQFSAEEQGDAGTSEDNQSEEKTPENSTG